MPALVAAGTPENSKNAAWLMYRGTQGLGQEWMYLSPYVVVKIGLINFNMHFLLKKFELALIFSFTNLVVNLSLLCPF